MHIVRLLVEISIMLIYCFVNIFVTGLYLEKESETNELLQRLVAAGKKLFLISNSGFPFM